MTINKSIKECRISKGITQIQMAEKLGVSDRYIRLLENGDRKFTADILINMANILQCSLDELVGRTYIDEDKHYHTPKIPKKIPMPKTIPPRK